VNFSKYDLPKECALQKWTHFFAICLAACGNHYVFFVHCLSGEEKKAYVARMKFNASHWLVGWLDTLFQISDCIKNNFKNHMKASDPNY
jgi:hypothetical protein